MQMHFTDTRTKQYIIQNYDIKRNNKIKKYQLTLAVPPEGVLVALSAASMDGNSTKKSKKAWKDHRTHSYPIFMPERPPAGQSRGQAKESGGVLGWSGEDLPLETNQKAVDPNDVSYSKWRFIFLTQGGESRVFGASGFAGVASAEWREPTEDDVDKRFESR